MIRKWRSQGRTTVGVGLLILLGATEAASQKAAGSADRDKETFLATAKIVSVEDIGHGVTKPQRAQLALGENRHAAKIQSVDKDLPDFFSEDGKAVVPMRDCWRFNIAAYKIDRLLELNMVPVAVARSYRGKPAAFTWWVDDVMMEEVERRKKDLQPPDPGNFERQLAVGRVFDELIMNIDRNLSNLLVTTDWKVALIDHSRSFTPYHGIRNTRNLTRCSRRLLEAMGGLTQTNVSAAVGKNLSTTEIKALLARRDRIEAFFKQKVAEQGEANVLFP